MRRKSKFSDFTRDPFCANNHHSRRDVGLAADGKRTCVTPAEGLKMTVTTKNTRRFVNSAPKHDRKGAQNKNYKARNLKNYNFSVETMNDKNVAVAHRNYCPLVHKRITKLHRANCRAAKANN